MSFLTILEGLNFDFRNFEQLSSQKFTNKLKYRISEYKHEISFKLVEVR